MFGRCPAVTCQFQSFVRVGCEQLFGLAGKVLGLLPMVLTEMIIQTARRLTAYLPALS